MVTLIDHTCLSKDLCVNRTDDGAAITLKPESLCRGCTEEIQRLYDALPDLRMGLRCFLAGSYSTSYGSKVNSTPTPASPLDIGVYDLLIDIDAITAAVGNIPIRDIVNRDVKEALTIRKVARQAEKRMGLERIWERRHLPCPTCRLPTLGNWSGSDTISCSSCGGVMTRAEFERICLIRGEA